MEFFSPGHLIVLAVVVAILFFGWKQLPDMSRSLGRSLRIFRTEIKGMTDDDKARDSKTEPAQAQRELPRAEVKRVEVTKPVPQQAATSSRPRPRPTPSRSAGTRSD